MNLPGKKDTGICFGPVFFDLFDRSDASSFLGAAIGAALGSALNNRTSTPPPPPSPRGGAPLPPPPGGPDRSNKQSELEKAEEDYEEGLYMFDKRMRTVVEAALEDGVITDTERRVLLKQCDKYGIDQDEFLVILDAVLLKRNKLLTLQMKSQMGSVPPPAPVAPPAPAIPKPAMPAAPSANTGRVDKCPNCGEPIPSGTVVCQACGFAFSHVQANSSAQRLSDMLHQIDQKLYNGRNGIWAQVNLEEKVCEEKVHTIRNFTVPNTKADLLEFLIMTRSRSEYKWTDSEEVKKVAKAYGHKHNECVEKARVYFSSDSDFKQFIDPEDGSKKKKRFGLF